MEFTEKQLQILEIAETLFAAKGFEGTSVRDIAEKAGINVAMISYYFGSKEKLLEALFKSRIGSVQVRMENLIKDQSLSPLQKINLLIDEYVERVLQHENFFKIMVTEQLITKNPSVLSSLKQLKLRNVELITQLIKEGQKKNMFRKTVDVVMMVNTMIGTVWQTTMNRDFYFELHPAPAGSTDSANTILIKRKLSIHIKALFKVILTYEA
ncbi:MAG: TetR/AcrR family transcriptional regulator [Chitinophagaceae bacterium]|nr:MAG: TetR/AcrR family transcriptional regulator [Chitinophagaceae bacterium]